MKHVIENTLCIAIASEDLKKKIEEELILPDPVKEIAKAILTGKKEQVDAK